MRLKELFFQRLTARGVGVALTTEIISDYTNHVRGTEIAQRLEDMANNALLGDGHEEWNDLCGYAYHWLTRRGMLSVRERLPQFDQEEEAPPTLQQIFARHLEEPVVEPPAQEEEEPLVEIHPSAGEASHGLTVSNNGKTAHFKCCFIVNLPPQAPMPSKEIEVGGMLRDLYDTVVSAWAMALVDVEVRRFPDSRQYIISLHLVAPNSETSLTEKRVARLREHTLNLFIELIEEAAQNAK